MKLYVWGWTGTLGCHTSTKIFVLAESINQAWDVLRKENWDVFLSFFPHNVSVPTDEDIRNATQPMWYDKPCAFIAWESDSD
jgi:hypothetical protein